MKAIVRTFVKPLRSKVIFSRGLKTEGVFFERQPDPLLDCSLTQAGGEVPSPTES